MGLLLFFYLANTGCGHSSPQEESVLSYLPDESELGGWEAVGDPQTAEGEDLFLLINGGAEIYYEYGFKRAVIHSYAKGGKSVNLEVYEMEDAASAYGVYSFKVGKNGQPMEIGDEARFEDYYLNVWKGNVVVTLVGFDTDRETRDGLLALARLIEAKIPGESVRPGIAEYLPETSSYGVDVHATYLEGNLGLLNHYQFSTQNIFGLKRGVVGDYGDYQVFLFAYEDASEARERFANARQHMQQSERFSRFDVHGEHFSVEDRENRYVHCRREQEYILIYVGAGLDEGSNILGHVSQLVLDDPGGV